MISPSMWEVDDGISLTQPMQQLTHIQKQMIIQTVR
jgi:hypothetical protein